MKFRDSALAHKYLDGLSGIEIGAAAHNPFNIPDCKFVDRTDDPDDIFKKGSLELCGEHTPVDYVMEGDDLHEFPDNTWDYVLTSHVLEHFFDPIKAIKEWFRVIKPGGYIFMIVPNSTSLPGEDRPPHRPQEIVDRHEGNIKPEDVYMGQGKYPAVDEPMGEHGHWSVWNLKDFIPLCYYYNWKIVESLEEDDKVGNGWCLVLQK
jgi:SAM-dependent methyltransferase